METTNQFHPGWVPFADALFRSLPGLAYAVDSSGRFLRWNDGYRLLLGISDEDMAKLSIIELVVEGDRHRAIEVMGAIFTGKQALFECTLAYQGREVQVFGTGIMATIEGAPHIVGTAIDISNLSGSALRLPLNRDERSVFETAPSIVEHRRSLEQARVNERRLAMALSATSDGMWEWNLASGELYFSPRWYEMLGYAAGSLPATLRTFYDLCHPDEVSHLQRAISNLQSGGAPGRHDVEFRLRRADGRWAWIFSRIAVSEQGPDGKPLMCSGVNTDVTESKRAQAAITQWKQRYDHLTSESRRIVYQRTGSDIEWGGVFEQVWGYCEADMRGGVAQWLDRIHPEDRAEIASSYRSAVSERRAFSGEYRFRHRDGEYLYMEDRGYPQVAMPGVELPFVGTLTDVSEERRARQERERLEERLRHAQKMESVGRLAGGVAHDFNNLLTAIGGNIALCRATGTLSPEGEELLRAAGAAVESAALVTRRLLTFSRKQVLQVTSVNINDVVIRVQQMLNRLLGENIALDVDLSSPLWFTEIDEHEIELVLVNLVVNSRDAITGRGKISIHTRNAVTTGSGTDCEGPLQFVVLTVTDDGCGMSADVQAHLFEPFFTTKEVGKGTGLGLATAYGLVKQCGGHIDVESETGRGTSISVWLPRKAEVRVAPRSRAKVANRGNGETIVVVEDEELVRSLLVRVLQHLGYTVHSFATGEDALVLLADTQFRVDLLLTDVVMPGMNGRELAQSARGIRPALKVLFASGYTNDIIAGTETTEELEFIGKPYSVPELSERIRRILGAPQPIAEA